MTGAREAAAAASGDNMKGHVSVNLHACVVLHDDFGLGRRMVDFDRVSIVELVLREVAGVREAAAAVNNDGTNRFWGIFLNASILQQH